MSVTHHEKCLRRAKVRRKSGVLSYRLESIAKTEKALRKIFDCPAPSREEIEESIMPKAKCGSEITARYILSRYFGHPRKLLNKMSDEECQLFLNEIGVY